MSDASARQRLDTPRTSRRLSLGLDVEAVGRVSENIARFSTALSRDPDDIRGGVDRAEPLRGGTGMGSVPVHPAQPGLLHTGCLRGTLILLAQNRQENRDRVALEEDRRRAEQTKADTEYLARELAALRLAVGEVATRDYLRRELEQLHEALESIREKNLL